jgi:hypothetical protein
LGKPGMLLPPSPLKNGSFLGGGNRKPEEKEEWGCWLGAVWHLDKETGGHYAKLDCIVFLGFLPLEDGDLLLVLVGCR